jgi:hypothetical protein
VTTAYAYDAAYEAALVIFYDKTCTKLKEGAGFNMKEAQDSVQDDYKNNPAEFCANTRRNINCMLDYYLTKKMRSCWGSC